MSEYEEGFCDRCEMIREVRWTTDPFLAEIYPEEENEPAWWCDECWQERADDV